MAAISIGSSAEALVESNRRLAETVASLTAENQRCRRFIDSLEIENSRLRRLQDMQVDQAAPVAAPAETNFQYVCSRVQTFWQNHYKTVIAVVVVAGVVAVGAVLKNNKIQELAGFTGGALGIFEIVRSWTS